MKTLNNINKYLALELAVSLVAALRSYCGGFSFPSTSQRDSRQDGSHLDGCRFLIYSCADYIHLHL